MQKQEIYEDTAMQKGLTWEAYVKTYTDAGWKVIHTYMHPAVGNTAVITKER